MNTTKKESNDKGIKSNSIPMKLESRTVDVHDLLSSDRYAHDIVYSDEWFVTPVMRIIALELANIERLTLRKGIEIDINRLDGVLLMESLISSVRMLMLHFYGGVYRRFSDLGDLSPGKSLALAGQIGIPPKFLQTVIVALQPILIGKRIFIPNPNLFRSRRRFNEGSFRRHGASLGAPSVLARRYGISWNAHLKTLLKEVYGINLVDIANIRPRLNLSVRPIRFVRQANLVVRDVPAEAENVSDNKCVDGEDNNDNDIDKDFMDDVDSEEDSYFSEETDEEFEFLGAMDNEVEFYRSRYDPTDANQQQNYIWDGGYVRICERLEYDTNNFSRHDKHNILWYYPYARSEDNPRLSFARRDFLYIDIRVGRLRQFYTGKQITRLELDAGNFVPRGFNKYSFDFKNVLRSIFDRPGVLALGLQHSNFTSTEEMGQELLIARQSAYDKSDQKYGALTVFATSFAQPNELEIVNHFKISANVVNVLSLDANMTVKESLFNYEANPES